MTNEELKKELSKYFNEQEMNHYEDKGMSLWSFKTGRVTLDTGDGGAKMLLEQLKKQFKEYIAG